MNKNDKEGKTTASSSLKDNKLKSSSESHVELDSRLLSALLTVSIIMSQFCTFFSCK